MKIALILAPGFEEIEAMTPVDVLRRAGFKVDILGFSKQVTGSHAITVQADKVWEGDLSIYDMIVLPGGLPGSDNLRDDERLITALQEAYRTGKWLAAVCAAPKVLGRAGLLEGRRYTCFPGVETEIAQGDFRPEVVIEDGGIITGRGAGTSLAFAYKLVEVLGGDAASLSQKMMYNQLFD